MKLYIKNMVCIRCKMVVKSELEKLGIKSAAVSLGEVRLKEALSSEQCKKLGNALKRSGFQLVDQERSLLIEKISTMIIEWVHYTDEPLKSGLPDFLSRKLHHEFSYLANLFSEVRGTTIEKFFTMHKIEKVKELIVYYELNLNEIAYQLNYGSVAKLSRQFLDTTGFSPVHFQKIKELRSVVK